MRITILALAVSVSLRIYADLDRIDADGVTETGGSSAYARMLPRTGADGKLSATLLPPVADWASQPIAGLYYVSAGATSEGNGSPQYPFKTLTYAAAHVSSGTALLLVPATYSGSITVGSGDNLTVYGAGSATYISSLSVVTSGNSENTELRLCGLHAGTVSVAGGRINIRLTGSTVDNLTGAATPVTVTRTDMGSYVYAYGMPSYTDTYTGYSTAPQAVKLVDSHAGTTNITLSEGRALFHSPYADETVAYVSDIVDATNAVYITTGALHNEDVRLAGLVMSEATIRTNADIALAAAISNSVDALNGQITLVGNNWSDQVSTLSDNLSLLRSDHTDLYIKETNDVDKINKSIESVKTAYKAADTSLKTFLLGEISDSANTVSDTVPGIADARAVIQIGYASNVLVSAAVAQAKKYTDDEINDTDDRITSVSAQVSEVKKQSNTNKMDIATIKGDILDVKADISGLEEKEEEDITTVTEAIATEKASVTAAYKAADTAVTTAQKAYTDTKTQAVSDSINSKADARIEAKKSSIVNEAKTAANTYTDNAVADMNTQIGNNKVDIAGLKSTVYDSNSGLSAIKGKINTIIECLQKIKNNDTDWSVPSSIP